MCVCVCVCVAKTSVYTTVLNTYNEVRVCIPLIFSSHLSSPYPNYFTSSLSSPCLSPPSSYSSLLFLLPPSPSLSSSTLLPPLLLFLSLLLLSSPSSSPSSFSQSGYHRVHSVNTNGEAADREERQEILHHDDKDQLGEKEGKQGSEEEGVSCGGEGRG